MPPIRSPRRIYLIPTMARNVDDADDIIDNLPGGAEPKTTTQVYAKMKESIGNYLGLTYLPYSAPDFEGEFKPGGLNAGYKFRRRIGGYRFASYTLLPVTTFELVEIVYNKATKTWTTIPNNFASMTIGFPVGHTVTTFIGFLGTTSRIPNIARVITPSGVGVDISAIVVP